MGIGITVVFPNGKEEGVFHCTYSSFDTMLMVFEYNSDAIRALPGFQLFQDIDQSWTEWQSADLSRAAEYLDALLAHKERPPTLENDDEAPEGILPLSIPVDTGMHEHYLLGRDWTMRAANIADACKRALSSGGTVQFC